jgi:hypothetical protein
MHSVSFVVSPRTAALLQKEPSSTSIARDGTRAQGSLIDTLVNEGKHYGQCYYSHLF